MAGIILLILGFFALMFGLLILSDACSEFEDVLGLFLTIIGGIALVVGLILTIAGARHPNKCHEPVSCAPQHIERAEVRQPTPQIFTTPNGVKVEVSGCDNCTVKVTTSP